MSNSLSSPEGGPAAVGDADAILLRPIRADDLPLLRHFVRHLSRETGYKRLLSGRTPTELELQRWTAIDASREAAVVAVDSGADGERLLGVARFAMEAADEADFAIVLADGCQGRGLGRALMVRLLAAAREHGVRRLSGVTLSTNVAMLSLARALGFRATRLPGAITTMLSLDIGSGAQHHDTRRPPDQLRCS
jgi:acetyltransferase